MVLSFSQLGKYGRLGNHFFQIHATFGLAEKYGAAASFPTWKYEQYFEPVLPHGEIPAHQIQERFFYHHDLGIDGDCDLFGYFQSEKYFGSTRLKFKPEFMQEIKNKHSAFSIQHSEMICIHIRRGDYVGNPNYYQLTPAFYIDALITHFPNWQDYDILIISDDIEYCKLHFGCMPASRVYFGGTSEIEDMALASLCDHFIISNSSFGWWAAYLGEKPHSKIIHCGRLHAGRLESKGHQDYYPVRWIEHKREEYKIPLRDLTFTIPVSYDHEYRKENIDLILYMLQASFDTHIIICEQGGKKFEYVSQWVKYVREKGPDFHRTKMLNDMAGLAQTPYIANWDADILIPPMQILCAVEELRAGADMVFPYDGRFARMQRPWFTKIQDARDLGIVKGETFKGMEADHNSVGGAVMFNREAFFDGGLENQNFISFGPEDCERHDRFKKLGYDIRRVGGALYHLNHYVGVNSSPRNPHFAENEKELEKIRGMTVGELRAYIDSWPWRHAYTSRYYHEISQGAIRSAQIIMEALYFKPASVIDIGCGVGQWHNGHENYTGLDYRIDRKDLLIPQDHFIELDLNREVLAGGEKYGLCICLEVAEHLKPSRADTLIWMLTNLSDRVLFSAAIPFQGGRGHVNEQWQSYWGRLFFENGFGPSKHQPLIRYNPDVEIWYRQNMVLYERDAEGMVMDFVLPEYYEQIIKHLKNNSA